MKMMVDVEISGDKARCTESHKGVCQYLDKTYAVCTLFHTKLEGKPISESFLRCVECFQAEQDSHVMRHDMRSSIAQVESAAEQIMNGVDRAKRLMDK